MASAEQVLEFWFETLTREEQFSGEQRIDDMIRSRFFESWMRAAGGGLSTWEQSPKSTLALIILLDQFPRNMFRDSGQSFHSDALAREIASRAIERGFDMRISVPDRLFIYMPYMHSERLEDQDRCVELFAERMENMGEQNLLHARAHRGIIELFSRFPFRNQALGRENTAAETEWLEQVGYMKFVQQLAERDKL